MPIAHFHARTRESIADLRKYVTDIAPEDAYLVAQDLYAVSHQIRSSRSLRSALHDIATSAEVKESIIKQLFATKINTTSLEVLLAAVKSDWSTDHDLLEALDITANEAILNGAQAEGILKEVSNQLLYLADLCKRNPQIEQALTDTRVSLPQRQEWLSGLLAGKFFPITIELIKNNFAKSLPVDALIDLAEQATHKLGYKLAIVTTASPIGQTRINHLTTKLSEIFDHEVFIYPEVDPKIIGGALVRVGYEIIDGSISQQLIAAYNSF